jgi:hypothetical protein
MRRLESSRLGWRLGCGSLNTKRKASSAHVRRKAAGEVDGTHEGHAVKRDEDSVLEPALEEPSKEVKGVQRDRREEPWLSVRSVVGDGSEEADE